MENLNIRFMLRMYIHITELREFNLELRVTLLANNLPARRKEPSSRSLAGAATAVKPDWSGHVVIDFKVLVDVIERVL